MPAQRRTATESTLLAALALVAVVLHEQLWQWAPAEDAPYWVQVADLARVGALAFALHCFAMHPAVTAVAVLATGYATTTSVCAYAWLQIRWPLKEGQSMCTQWLQEPVMLGSYAMALWCAAAVWRHARNTSPPQTGTTPHG